VRKKKSRVQKTKAVVYLRVSTDEQVLNLSLSTQQQRTIAHCTSMGWPVVAEFRDEGKSAKTIQREEFQKMIKFCHDPANKVGFVVVNDLSRFSRQTTDVLVVRALLEAHGVHLRSVSEPIDETPAGTLMTTVLAGMAQFDNDQKAVRTKTGMLKAASIGRWPHKAPLGYLNVPGEKDGPNIVPDQSAATLIAKAFQMAATGTHTTAEILRNVTQLGLRTAKGKPVPPQTFQKTLVNPIYKGVIHLPEWDFTGPGSFLPLVDPEVFDRGAGCSFGPSSKPD
jgi:site-specific DNA recombinase